MPQTNLCLDTLGQLNHGLAAGIIDKALARMVEDLEDRGAEDNEPRTVSIEITGITSKKGLTTVEVKATCKLPKYNAGQTAAEIVFTNDGGFRYPVLQFRGDSPDNPRQQTFEDVNNESESQEDQE